MKTIQDLVTESLGSGKKIFEIFIVPQNAFYTVELKILFPKLTKVGLSNTAQNL